MMTTHVLDQPRRTEAHALADRLRARIETMRRAGAIESEIAAELLALLDGYRARSDGGAT